MHGDPGFRNLKKYNAAVLVKTAWNLIHSPKDLWNLEMQVFQICHPLPSQGSQRFNLGMQEHLHGIKYDNT